MKNALPPIRSREEAIALLKTGLGRVENGFTASIAAPLWWVQRLGRSSRIVRNGSCFFMDAGLGVFGVTAAHVVEALVALDQSEVIQRSIGTDLEFTEARLIDCDSAIDIATFQVSRDELDRIQKTAITGSQSEWPPSPPEPNRGVHFAGFPEVEQLSIHERHVSFGIVTAGGIASSVSERNVSCQIEREYLISELPGHLPPENYDFSGMSGGPMISVVESTTLRTWRLAGVIYQGPNISSDPSSAIAGLEVIRARRADFIRPNGMLDRKRWSDLI